MAVARLRRRARPLARRGGRRGRRLRRPEGRRRRGRARRDRGAPAARRHAGARAGRRASGGGPSTTRDTSGVAAYEAAGWTRKRDVLRMWLDLAQEPPRPVFPADVELRTYQDEDARRLHAFLELAFADTNDRVEPFDEWLHFMTVGNPDFDPAFWHLAEGADGVLAGCCLTWSADPAGGWVKDLAVHPAGGGRGSARRCSTTRRTAIARPGRPGSGSRSTPTTRPARRGSTGASGTSQTAHTHSLRHARNPPRPPCVCLPHILTWRREQTWASA